MEITLELEGRRKISPLELYTTQGKEPDKPRKFKLLVVLECGRRGQRPAHSGSALGVGTVYLAETKAIVRKLGIRLCLKPDGVRVRVKRGGDRARLRGVEPAHHPQSQ